MSKKLRVGVIGGGNMGSAIIGGIRGKYDIRVCEKSKPRARAIKKEFKLTALDLDTVIERSDVIVIAIKPQNIESLLKKIRDKLTKKHLVISIAAGITTATLEKQLGKDIRVIRAMPNLPVRINMGMTALAKGKKASTDDMRQCKKIFQNIGLTIELKENKMDAVTAVSGSGPAYVFLFIEAFVQAARDVGFTKKQAEQLVVQTINGSFQLFTQSGDDAAKLRKNVTSKKGTTEAALKEFSKGKYTSIFKKALKAAKKRSKELSA